MRRLLPVALPVIILAVALTAGCSRQPHVGEWETEIHAGPKAVIWGGNYVFDESGYIQFVRFNIDKPRSTDAGTYKIDYSKDPIQIDIQWGNGKSEVGILRFIGTEKNLMEIELAPPGSGERPAGFGRDTLLLTKKAKK
jgi:hypothetical protein